MDIPRAFSLITKVTGPICNMDCTYCFYLEKEKLYPGTSEWAMQNDILEKYIQQYITLQSQSDITFTWQGGEPTLLGIEYFEKIIDLQNKYANSKTIFNSFQTNGILLSDEWCSFFKENNFLIGLSIDGPEEIHDKYRVLRGGQPTFEQVIRGINLLKKYKVEFNTLTCVHKENAYHGKKVYNFLKEIGSTYLQFIPIVERTTKDKNEQKLNLVSPSYENDALVAEWSVESLQYGKFLSEIFDEWVKKDVGKYFVQIFDIALEAWSGQEPSLCVFKKTCGDALALEHNGDLYSCDHYVYRENKLGNIMEDNMLAMINSGKQIKFGLDKEMGLPQFCRTCEFKFVCNGECPKHRFNYAPDGEYGLNYLCEGYKFFFDHIDPYMQFMVNELNNHRPPANVMQNFQ